MHALGLDDQRCDLALALHVVHETISPAATMTALARCLNPGGQLLLVEPPGHCSPEIFKTEVAAAEGDGLVRIAHPRSEGRKRLALWK